MTAPSPADVAGDLLSFGITSNGQPISAAYQVLSIDLWAGVNRLPKARLVIADGDAATGTFPISESGDFIPGVALTVSLGYDGSTTLIFSGIIYRQGLDIGVGAPSRLVVEATDKAMAMTLSRHSALFQNSTDSAIANTLIANAGLTANVSATSTQYPAVVQYYSTDWDFLVLRAQINGMVVLVDNATVSVAAPDTAAAPVLTLTFGDSILGFRGDMDAATQYSAGAITSVAWDPATQALAQSATAQASVTQPGNLSSATLAQVFNVSPYTQQTAAGLGAADLTTWSSAELMKSQLAKIRAELRFQGSALAKSGAMVTLAGLGDRFNGPAYVSAVHHSVAAGFWHTTVDIGLSADWFAASAANIAAPATSGQLPPVGSLQTGIVLKIDDDPDGEFRVQVALPLLQASGHAGIWARLGGIYASAGFGAAFFPEVGDEVAVAFMDNDPRFPVIVGSLYSKTRPSPVTPDAQNNTKSLVTRTKLRVDFFEDKPAVQIGTPGQQSIRLDDDTKSVTITDMNGNTATLAPGGITLNSAADITLTAKGNITVSAGANLTLKATADVAITGVQVSADADGNFAASAAGTAKLTAAGEVVILGALVNIN